ncbi:replication initiator protein [Capybara microvirus Cap1_SP_168]|nr:replication initiator protein [Capybara microvirus Cap1_SP_168]
MTCYHPLKRFTTGFNPETGKSIGKVVPYRVDHLEKRYGDDRFYQVYDPVDYTTYTINGTKFENMPLKPSDVRIYSDYEVIPCGKCIGCRLDYSRMWSSRLMAELPYHHEAWFLTLTYNDLCLPSHIVERDGKLVETHSLVKKHFQDFMKRLRRRFPDGSIKYYCCGEYGSKSMRPHYHAILFFDSSLQDYVFPNGVINTNKLHKVQDGYRYYVNRLIDQLWYVSDCPDVSAGFHYLTQVTYETICYVTQYVTKKLNGDAASIYQEYDLEPEFSLISTKPALGRQFYEEHKAEIYADDKFVFESNGKPVIFRPPAYYDHLFDIEAPEIMSQKKDKRKELAINHVDALLRQTDKDYPAILADQESAFKSRASSRMKAKYNKAKGRRV